MLINALLRLTNLVSNEEALTAYLSVRQTSSEEFGVTKELEEVLEILEGNERLWYRTMQERAITPSQMFLRGGGDFCSLFPCSMFHAAIIFARSLLMAGACATEKENVLVEDMFQRAAFVLRIAEQTRQHPYHYFTSASRLHIIFPLQILTRFALDAGQQLRSKQLLEYFS